jgi:hypothetical protein
MKVISKLLMFTLVLSVFAGCSKDDEEKNLPVKDVEGTYKGDLTVSPIEPAPIKDVPIEIKYISDSTVQINIKEGSISVIPVPISATCTVKSDKEKYSLSGKATITLPGMGDLVVVVANTSSIKSGEAILNMTTTIPVVRPSGESESDEPTVIMTPIKIDFKGKKQ